MNEGSTLEGLGGPLLEDWPDRDRIGEVISGRYRLDEHIGDGGMGDVYRAEHVEIKKTVAVKILRREALHHDNVVERFRREAQAAANIDHPNICSSTDFGRTDGGDVYAVMEYLDGETLGDYLSRRGPFEVERAAQIGDTIAAALERAHQMGVVHRDVKPENVMLVDGDDPDGTRKLKLLDFGLAQVRMDEQASTLTEHDTAVGTPEYMAPEQATRAPIDHRADLYALGVVLYELVSGRPPFVTDEPIKTLAAHLEQTPEPPSAVDGAVSIPARFEQLILDLLEKNPDDRPQSIAALRERLEPFRHPRATASSDSGFLRTVEIRVPTEKALEATAQKVRGWVGEALRLLRQLDLPDWNRSTKIIVVGLVGLVTSLLAGAALLSNADSTRSTSTEKPAETRPDLRDQRSAYFDRIGADGVLEALRDDAPDRAIDELRAIRDSAPESAHLDYLSGRVYAADEQWEKALDHYDWAIDRNPSYVTDPTLIADVVAAFGSSNTAAIDRAKWILSGNVSRRPVRRALAELAWSGDTAETRRRALQMLEQSDALAPLEPWRRASVRLRHARGCDQHRKYIERLAELDDPRGLEVLRLYERMPEDGCGPFGGKDCYGCIRDDLADAIAALEDAE